MASIKCSSENNDVVASAVSSCADKDEASESTTASADDADNDNAENCPTAIVIDALEQLLAELFPGPKHMRHYKMQLATAKGDNYLGVVYRISVVLLDSDERHSLIVKVPPLNSLRRKQFFARPCFLRESLAYEQFLPLVAQYQQEHDVPPAERFCHYPACYRCLTVEQHEAIFLEDLCASGFRLFDRFGDLQPEHVRVVMRAYGKLHAVSLALKQQQPERLRPFQQIVDIFKQREHDQPLGVYFEQLKVSALGALDCDGGGDDKYIERLKAYFRRGSTFELLLEQLDAGNCEPYAVVCHGDCWNNNIMYRHDVQQVAVEARLIDWQLMRYASPVTDLAYYFFTCTTKQFRDAHYNDMLNVYYDELTQQLARLGTSSAEVFPRSAFDAQLRQKSAAGLLFAMMVLPIVTISGNDVPDLEAISEYIEAGNTTDLHGAGFLGARNEQAYKQRIRGVIIDCVERDYI